MAPRSTRRRCDPRRRRPDRRDRGEHRRGDDALPLPPVTVLTDNSGDKGGDIFISPFGDSSTYQNGAEILSPDGKKVLWSHAAPAGKRIRTSAPRHTTASRS